MASPQCENGYTRIANELLEAIAKRVTNSEWLRMMLILIRYTYGYHKVENETNYNVLGQKTNMTEDSARRVICELSTALLINYMPVNGKRLIVKINKDYDRWRI